MNLWQILPVLLVTSLRECVTVTFHDYIIVGAGPAGLQMGYFLQRADRDYMIMEKNNVSGSFFSSYPRHGRLISINKRHTGRLNAEFNLRHDWNSLLSDDPQLLFTKYSSDFFPDKENMITYLHNYTDTWQLNVMYNTEIYDITYLPNTSESTRHRYHNHLIPDTANYIMSDGKESLYACRILLVATGMWKPNVPPMKGLDLAEGYEHINLDPSHYEGKTVLILGHGNSAFETADAIYGHASVVHVAGRSRVRLAWETHYVGDIRGINNGLLDTYQLKSLDGVLEGRIQDLQLTREKDQIRAEVRDFNVENFPLRETYDHVIRCLGFTFDYALFSNDSCPQASSGMYIKKFPLITSRYEAVGNPHMYIIGGAAHSLDYRKSAGGFIHGFRYSVRYLHHVLENKYHGITWPYHVIPVTSILSYVVKRINEASGMYQMFGFLADVIAFNADAETAHYFHEVTISSLVDFESVTGYPLQRCIVMVMEYGGGYSGPGKDVFNPGRATAFANRAHKSNFLHPVLYYYDSPPNELKRNDKLPRPRRLHHVVEDFLTLWTAPTAHVLPLRRFLEVTLKHDLRNFYDEDCFRFGLTYKTLPLACKLPMIERK